MCILRLVLVTAVVSCTVSVLAEELGNTWQPPSKLAAELAMRIPNANFDEAKVPPYTLPDPLVALDGSDVNRDMWPARRAEILNLFREHMHGETPVGRPDNEKFRVLEEDANAFDGKATRKLVEISFDTPHAGRLSFRVQLYVPNEVDKPVPAWCCANFRDWRTARRHWWLSAVYALAIFDRRPIAEDDATTYRNGVINAFSGDGELAPNAWRSIAAWAWGRPRDGLSRNRS